jgi:hypothetical protein
MMVPQRLSAADYKLVDLIEQYFRVVSPPGDLIEVRAFPDKSTGRRGVARGLFTDLRLAAITAVHMTNAGLQTYYSLNPIKPDSVYAKKRVINQPCWRVSHTAKDYHIGRRRNYLFEIDAHKPVRYKDYCSTGKEKAIAWDQVQRLRQYLSERGWPEPIVIDSGNGVWRQLIFPVNDNHNSR